MIMAYFSIHGYKKSRSKEICTQCIEYDSGMQQGGRQGGQPPPQILADQLTLSQPGGTHYPHPVLLAPRNFRPCDGPAQ